MSSHASSSPTLPADDELYAPPTPPHRLDEVETSSDTYVVDYEHPLDAYLHLQDNDPISSKTVPDQPIPRIRNPMLAQIFKNDGEVDFRAWLKSDIPIPSYFPEQHIITLLLSAKISAARLRTANLSPAILKLKLRAAHARPRPDTEDPSQALALAQKEQCTHTMLTHARRAIDTAGLLRRPDLQSRGFYYLALAAQDEGNEALAESYFEKALETRGSWEGGMSATALGVAADDSEGHTRGRHARRSIFGKESGSEDGGKTSTKGVPVDSLEAELVMGGWMDGIEKDGEGVDKEEAVPEVDMPEKLDVVTEHKQKENVNEENTIHSQTHGRKQTSVWRSSWLPKVSLGVK